MQLKEKIGIFFGLILDDISHVGADCLFRGNRVYLCFYCCFLLIYVPETIAFSWVMV